MRGYLLVLAVLREVVRKADTVAVEEVDPEDSPVRTRSHRRWPGVKTR
jgi:hypothetical protein